MRYLTKNKITRKSILDLLNQGDYLSGSFILITGRVRKDRVGKSCVKEIIYESCEKMAEKKIRESEKETKNKLKVKEAIIKHRVGKVKLGEITFLVAVFSSHRKEGFSAVQFIIDEIKRRVHIWKKEVLSNGKIRWMEEVNV